MRLLFIFTAILVSNALYGQQISGVVIDGQNRQPIEKALVSSSKTAVLTDIHGRFTILISDLTDTIRISALGYRTNQLTQQPSIVLVTVELARQIIHLNEVKVFAKRDRIKDSLDTRTIFARSFNSAAPKFKDIVRVSKNTGPIPIAGITIIPSELIRAIAYKQSREYKFKKRLLTDESDKYIDSRFSKELVSEITKLEAGSLALFMDKYRPTINTIKKMTGYDLMIYIKKSSIDFKSDN